MTWGEITLSVIILSYMVWSAVKFYRGSKRAALQKTELSQVPGFPTVFMARNIQSPVYGQEEGLVIDALRRCLLAWPGFRYRIDEGKYHVWLVRSPSELVVYGGKLLHWNKIGVTFYPGDPERGDPNCLGWGGGAEWYDNYPGGAVFVSLYHVDRSPEKLLNHELTHAVCRVRGNLAPIDTLEKLMEGI
jgi:hypothetical protein